MSQQSYLADPFLPQCATCELWGGPRQLNGMSQHVTADSDAEGMCAQWRGNRRAVDACGFYKMWSAPAVLAGVTPSTGGTVGSGPVDYGVGSEFVLGDIFGILFVIVFGFSLVLLVGGAYGALFGTETLSWETFQFLGVLLLISTGLGWGAYEFGFLGHFKSLKRHK